MSGQLDQAGLAAACKALRRRVGYSETADRPTEDRRDHEVLAVAIRAYLRHTAVTAERDRWIRLFSQLERHVSRHWESKQEGAFCDDADDVLHQGWRQVLKAAQEPQQ